MNKRVFNYSDHEPNIIRNESDIDSSVDNGPGDENDESIAKYIDLRESEELKEQDERKREQFVIQQQRAMKQYNRSKKTRKREEMSGYQDG